MARTNDLQELKRTFRVGVAAHQAGNLTEAERHYRQILKALPDQLDTLTALGHLERQRGHQKEAYSLFSKALRVNPRSDELLASRGNALLELGRTEEAIQDFDKALALIPNAPLVMMNRASALMKLGRHDEALSTCEKLLASNPSFAPALYTRGNVLLDMRRAAEALESFDQAIALKSDYAEAFHNRGVALRDLHRLEEAVQSYQKAIAIRFNYAEAFNNLGESLRELNRLEEALRSHEMALAIKPTFAEALANLAIVFLDLRRFEEALRSLDQALAIKPDFVLAMQTRGSVQRELGRHEEAAASFQRVWETDPSNKYALVDRIYSRLHICSWNSFAEDVDRLGRCLKAEKCSAQPFFLAGISSSAQEQYLSTRRWATDRYPTASAPCWRGERYSHAKIRLAYVSADFREHAVAYVIAGLFEGHDRTNFDTFGISLRRAPNSDMQARLRRAFDHFIDAEGKSDIEVARLLRDLEVDIAVDLNGFTSGHRTRVFSLRPAPVQVNYLGYPGTMGVEYMDYILADRFAIPEEHRTYYSESIVYLPETYQLIDSTQRVAQHAPTRTELGLPDHGCVFCSFNGIYKITPAVFDVWMRLLRKIDGSVLWLAESNATASANLRREASTRGIAPDRLVFAPRVVSFEDHLARYQLADLFLDTLPYNGHSTSSYALWAGLPVLTCLGGAFPGRVGAGLLNAIGLPELVTTSLEEYEALALALATDSIMLMKLRDKLARHRLTYPLCDTDRFRRHIEGAYVSMWERSQRGEPPASFSVEPIGL